MRHQTRPCDFEGKRIATLDYRKSGNRRFQLFKIVARAGLLIVNPAIGKRRIQLVVGGPRWVPGVGTGIFRMPARKPHPAELRGFWERAICRRAVRPCSERFRWRLRGLDKGCRRTSSSPLRKQSEQESRWQY